MLTLSLHVITVLLEMPGEHVETRIPAFQSGCPTPKLLWSGLERKLHPQNTCHKNMQQLTIWSFKDESCTEIVPMLSPEIIWWNTSLWSAPTLKAVETLRCNSSVVISCFDC